MAVFGPTGPVLIEPAVAPTLQRSITKARIIVVRLRLNQSRLAGATLSDIIGHLVGQHLANLFEIQRAKHLQSPWLARGLSKPLTDKRQRRREIRCG